MESEREREIRLRHDARMREIDAQVSARANQSAAVEAARERSSEQRAEFGLESSKELASHRALISNMTNLVEMKARMDSEISRIEVEHRHEPERLKFALNDFIAREEVQIETLRKSLAITRQDEEEKMHQEVYKHFSETLHDTNKELVLIIGKLIADSISKREEQQGEISRIRLEHEQAKEMEELKARLGATSGNLDEEFQTYVNWLEKNGHID